MAVARAELFDVSTPIETEKVPGKIVYLLPGQGGQKIGMGNALYNNSEAARRVFDYLELIKPGLLTLMSDGTKEKLDDTANAQPAIVGVSLATYFAFLEVNPLLHQTKQPLAFLGHSAGQVSAMAAAGVVDLETALRIAVERGRLMKEVGEKDENRGGMLALLGATPKLARLLCSTTSKRLGQEGIWIANDNTDGQLVLSGKEEHIANAMAHAQELGIKKTIQLAVSIAAHCPLMKEMQLRFTDYLSRIPFRKPSFPIICNTTAEATLDPDAMKADLINASTSGVRFREALETARRIGATSFVEIGEGPLSGFAQRAMQDSRQFQISAG
ncbi:MAG: ACP S-malonyltransferase [Candidatus Levybacteria bacterium]|nr:ACP S-malonyltransferase [Candidatus Levybacteria bacterium]